MTTRNTASDESGGLMDVSMRENGRTGCNMERENTKEETVSGKKDDGMQENDLSESAHVYRFTLFLQYMTICAFI